MFKISYDKKITMVQGDTGVIRMRIHNYELSQGDEVRFAIVNKANPSILLCQHSDKKIVLEKQVTVFEKDGSARIIIYPYDTEYLQPGKYLYEIQVKTKDGIIDTVVPLTSFTLMDGSIQGEFGQTTPSKPEPTPSEIELRFKRLENEIIPELGNRITNVENEIDSIMNICVTPNMFGAKGDGITDDTQIIQYVFDNFNHIYFPSDKYLVTQPLYVKSDRYIDFAKSKIIFNFDFTKPHTTSSTDRINSVGVLNLRGKRSEDIKQIDITQTDMTKGIIYCANHNFSVGDLVKVRIYTGEQETLKYKPNVDINATVLSIGTNTVEIDYCILKEDYDFSKIPVENFTILTISKVEPIKNVTIKNFDLLDITPLRNNFVTNVTTQYPNDDSHYACCGISLRDTLDINLENIRGNNCLYSLIFTYYTTNTIVKNVECFNPRLIGPGEGYLIQLNNYNKVYLENLRSSGVRHIVDFTHGGYASVKNAYAYRSRATALTFHGAYDHNIVLENIKGGNTAYEYATKEELIDISFGAGHEFGNTISNVSFKDCHLFWGDNVRRSTRFAKNVRYENCYIKMTNPTLQSTLVNCTLSIEGIMTGMDYDKRGQEIESWLHLINSTVYCGDTTTDNYYLEKFDCVSFTNCKIYDRFGLTSSKNKFLSLRHIKKLMVANCEVTSVLRVIDTSQPKFDKCDYIFTNNIFYCNDNGGIEVTSLTGTMPFNVVINSNIFNYKNTSDECSVRFANSFTNPLNVVITNNISNCRAYNTNIPTSKVIENNIGIS